MTTKTGDEFPYGLTDGQWETVQTLSCASKSKLQDDVILGTIKELERVGKYNRYYGDWLRKRVNEGLPVTTVQFENVERIAKREAATLLMEGIAPDNETHIDWLVSEGKIDDETANWLLSLATSSDEVPPVNDADDTLDDDDDEGDEPDNPFLSPEEAAAKAEAKARAEAEADALAVKEAEAAAKAEAEALAAEAEALAAEEAEARAEDKRLYEALVAEEAAAEAARAETEALADAAEDEPTVSEPFEAATTVEPGAIDKPVDWVPIDGNDDMKRTLPMPSVTAPADTDVAGATPVDPPKDDDDDEITVTVLRLTSPDADDAGGDTPPEEEGEITVAVRPHPFARDDDDSATGGATPPSAPTAHPVTTPSAPVPVPPIAVATATVSPAPDDDEASAATTTTGDDAANVPPATDNGKFNPYPWIAALASLLLIGAAMFHLAWIVMDSADTQPAPDPIVVVPTANDWIVQNSCIVGYEGLNPRGIGEKTVASEVLYSCTWLDSGTVDYCGVTGIEGRLYAAPGSCQQRSGYVLPPGVGS